jgi:hypothetical protein
MQVKLDMAKSDPLLVALTGLANVSAQARDTLPQVKHAMAAAGRIAVPGQPDPRAVAQEMYNMLGQMLAATAIEAKRVLDLCVVNGPGLKITE